MGLLMERPDQQKKQLGRTLLAEAESFARGRGALRIRMTVLHVRDTLIAWYELARVRCDWRHGAVSVWR